MAAPKFKSKAGPASKVGPKKAVGGRPAAGDKAGPARAKGFRTSSKSSSKKTIIIIIVLIFLMLAGIGTGLGIHFSKKDGENPAPSPSPSPADGSEDNDGFGGDPPELKFSGPEGIAEIAKSFVENILAMKVKLNVANENDFPVKLGKDTTFKLEGLPTLMIAKEITIAAKARSTQVEFSVDAVDKITKKLTKEAIKKYDKYSDQQSFKNSEEYKKAKTKDAKNKLLEEYNASKKANEASSSNSGFKGMAKAAVFKLIAAGIKGDISYSVAKDGSSLFYEQKQNLILMEPLLGEAAKLLGSAVGLMGDLFSKLG